MTGTLLTITRLSVLVFLVSSMSGIGLGLSLQQVVALVANFIIAPALALGSGRLLRLDEPFTLGLVLLGLVAGVSENQ